MLLLSVLTVHIQWLSSLHTKQRIELIVDENTKQSLNSFSFWHISYSYHTEQHQMQMRIFEYWIGTNEGREMHRCFRQFPNFNFNLIFFISTLLETICSIPNNNNRNGFPTMCRCVSATNFSFSWICVFLLRPFVECNSTIECDVGKLKSTLMWRVDLFSVIFVLMRCNRMQQYIVERWTSVRTLN